MISQYLTMLDDRGDNDRFAGIYHANHRRLERLAAQILGPGPKAEDAVHDTFMKLIRHFDELRDRSEDRVTAWLTVVVKNTALDMLRRDRFETELDGACWEPAVQPDRGEFQALVALIRELPPDYRQVLELRFVAEWSLAEIGAHLGIPESTVKTRIFRGRKLLIERLRKEGYLDGRACI